MLRVENNKIKVSRGDSGNIGIKLPIIDSNSYVKYYDGTAAYYWYNSNENILYDTNYNVSNVNINTLNIVYYTFNVGDVITLNIYRKNGYTENALKTISTTISESTDTAIIALTESDTTIESIINKQITYWYDITLNYDKTIIGYDDEGAKEFIIYPAKGADE